MSKSVALLSLFASVSFSLVAAACAAPNETSASESNESETTESAILSGGSAACSGCTNEGDFALTVTGEGFSSLAGKRVSVAAVEPTLGAAQNGKPSVTLTTKIGSNGKFDLSCAKALSENYGYPSYGIWLDKNGDGKCGAGDLAIVNAGFYGWNWDIAVATRPGGTVIDPNESWRGSTPWEPADKAGRWGNEDFCAYYGFPQ